MASNLELEFIRRSAIKNTMFESGLPWDRPEKHSHCHPTYSVRVEEFRDTVDPGELEALRLGFVRSAGSRPNITRYLAPRKTKHLICAGSSQNEKLKCQLRWLGVIAGAETLNKGGHLRARKGLVMLLWSDCFGSPLETPSTGFSPDRKPAAFSPVQNGSDPLFYPSCRFRLRQPDWRQDFEHIGGIDLVNVAIANVRKGILAKRVELLISVLLVLP